MVENLRIKFRASMPVDVPVKTKQPTVEMNPERKELKGKVPTSMQ